MIGKIIRRILEYIKKKGGLLKAMKAIQRAIRINGFRVILFRLRNYVKNEYFIGQTKKRHLASIARENKQSHIEKKAVEKEISRFQMKPLVSIVIPVYNVPLPYLDACVDSVRKQIYPNWEICIADDASTISGIREKIQEYSRNDARIRYAFRDMNGHISQASNTALSLATGDFVALLDHDDMLSPYALMEFARLLNRSPDIDYVYTDEDKVDSEGARYFDPFFKPGWSPDTLLSIMYTSHLSIFRRSIIDAVGGFRNGYEGAQDYDLVLRVTERTTKIAHIPQVLYHWRAISGSTASSGNEKSYAFQAGVKARQDALIRRNISARIESLNRCDGVHILYNVPKEKLISIIIPTKNHYTDVAACIDSIMELSTWRHFEILLVDNGSDERESLDCFNSYSEGNDNLRILRMDVPFNYSLLNNRAVEFAKGELLLFLNNDTIVITPDWLERMAGQALQSHTGAVGAKLLYPDDTIQHCGVVGHRGHVAGHAFLHQKRDTLGYFNRTHIAYNFLAVTAACLMVKKDRFLQCGGFNETDLAVAFNDVDLNLSLLELGYYNVMRPDVLLYHSESKTRGYEDSPEKVARFQREIEYMRRKWAEKYLDNDPFYNENLNPEAYFNVL